MERFFRAVLRHRKLVVALFLVCTVAAAVCIPNVEVNGDFSDYLPEDSESTIALEVMDEVYGSDISNIRVYVEGISLAQAADLNETYSELEGVIASTWLGDNVDIYEPLALQDEDTVEAWYDGEGYLFQLTIEEPYEQDMIDELRAIAEALEGAGTVAIDGSAASTADLLNSVDTDMGKIVLIGVLCVLVIMMLTSTSFLHPVIALVVIGVAIVINMGTNIFRGEISSVTQMVAAVLQLAVSMDYSIVMFSTYRRVRETESDEFEAMVKTCVESFSVVISSAAVAFFAFISLMCMQFLIGADMGIVLAKGIVCSFFSIMLLMPCLLYMLRRPVERCTHRPLFGSARGFANVCRALAIPAALIVCIIVVPCYVAQDMTDFSYGSTAVTSPDSQLATDEEYIDEKFGESQMWVIMVPEGQWALENALVEELEALETTTSVISYSTMAGSSMPTGVVDDDTLSQLISGGYSRIVLTSAVAGESEETFALVETVRALCEEYYGDEYYLAGDSVSTYDIKVVATQDSLTVRMVSMLAIAIVLALMFKSISLPIILVLTIEVSIWINLAIPYFVGESISYIGYLVIDAVQLGAAVDYSIIYTHEYLKLRQQMPARKAARDAIANATIPILTSSCILMAAALGIYFVASGPMIQSLGMLIFRGALLAVILIFLVLPSLYIVLDWVIRHTSVGLNFYDPKKAQAQQQEREQEQEQEQATLDETAGPGETQGGGESPETAEAQLVGKDVADPTEKTQPIGEDADKAASKALPDQGEPALLDAPKHKKEKKAKKDKKAEKGKKGKKDKKKKKGKKD